MKKFSVFLIIAGILCLAAALGFAYYNQWDASRAGKASEGILEKIENGEYELTDDTYVPEGTSQPDESGEEAADSDADGENGAAPVFYTGKNYVSDGRSICGFIEIPILGLKLPVMADYNLSNLRYAPCRYTENGVPDDKIVIAGHNYRQHFGSLGNLVVGDEVIYTPVSGEPVVTKVVSYGTVEANDFISVSKGDWDLALFTCNFSGEMRILVRCAAVK